MTTGITSYEGLDALGRVRLSRSFFMRDFLYSEIAAWHELRNVPDHPDRAIEVGKSLCEQLLEPLQDTFGRIHVRSGYRSPTVNRFGNENKLNCATNEANFAAHIWDYADSAGRRGATACIVVPWLVDHIDRGGSWTDMAWWIHDHLPYSKLHFFAKLAAFNISWHEVPTRRIDSYLAPKGCLTQPGMPNHLGSHEDQYAGFPLLRAWSDGHPRRAVANAGAAPSGLPMESPPDKPAINNAFAFTAKSISGERPSMTLGQPRSSPDLVETDLKGRAPGPGVNAVPLPSSTGAAICYRAIHTKNLWRKVGTHRSLEAAINGKDGAAGLFARKARISYETHGNPLYVLVWEAGATYGYVVKADAAAANGICRAEVPMSDLLRFEASGQAGQRDLERYFRN